MSIEGKILPPERPGAVTEAQKCLTRWLVHPLPSIDLRSIDMPLLEGIHCRASSGLPYTSVDFIPVLTFPDFTYLSVT
jgi:hypothetical protein